MICTALPRFMLAVLGWPLLSQTDSMTLDGVELRLGMSREEVRSKFSPELYFDGAWELGADFVILARLNPVKPIGDLFFTRGRLTSIGRTWHRATNSTVLDFVKALHSLVSNLNSEGRVVATINAGSKREPEGTVDFVDIAFGTQSIRIVLADQELGEVRIKEVVLREVVETLQKGP